MGSKRLSGNLLIALLVVAASVMLIGAPRARPGFESLGIERTLSYTDPVAIASGRLFDFIASVDLNGDGLKDVLVRDSGSYPNRYLVADNLGNRRFSAPRTLVINTEPPVANIERVFVGSGSNPELLAIASGGISFPIYRLSPAGNNSFSATIVGQMNPPGSTDYFSDPVFADVNSDQAEDLVFGIQQRQYPSYDLRQGIRVLKKVNGRYELAYESWFGISPGNSASGGKPLYVADVTGDRISDIILTRSSGTGIPIVISGPISPTSAMTSLSSYSSVFSPVVADSNKDGVSDIIFQTSAGYYPDFSSGSTIRVKVVGGNLNLLGSSNLVGRLQAVADLDQSSGVEYLVAQQDVNYVNARLNVVDESGRGRWVGGPLGSPSVPQVVDIDGDGILDLMIQHKLEVDNAVSVAFGRIGKTSEPRNRGEDLSPVAAF